MKIPHSIRQNYKPIQPTLARLSDTVVYSEFLPDIRLQPYIYCYWEIKSVKPLDSPFVYRAVSDGCIEICFVPGLSRYNFVCGLNTQYSDFPLGNPVHFIGIRFLPGMFSHFFKCELSEITNDLEDIASIIPHTANFINNGVSPELEISIIRKYLDEHFLKVLFSVEPDFDNRFINSVNIILENKGIFNPDKILDLGVSPRHLRRIFNSFIGGSPKTFSKIVRFQNILRAKPSVTSLRESKIFYDLGYYDQSHFIKEFKEFYGSTPKEAFRK